MQLCIYILVFVHEPICNTLAIATISVTNVTCIFCTLPTRRASLAVCYSLISIMAVKDNSLRDKTASTAMQGQIQGCQGAAPSPPFSYCMIFDTPHAHTARVTVSDPYGPRTEKQIPFHRGFILVMRHGPYLALTAAFLFITVAIQVNANLFRQHFSDMTLNITVNGASPGSCQCRRTAGARC